MNFFRIQDENGFGPYAGRPDCAGWEDCCHAEQLNTPGPNSDAGMLWYAADRDRSEWKFGFLTLAQLNDWFTDSEILKLRRLGFTIVRLDVSALDCRASELQAVYRGPATIKEGNINHERRMGENSNQLQLW
jgi:hypothetical protein